MSIQHVTLCAYALLCIAAPVAAQVPRTDETAMQFLARARIARLRNDSALASYEATALQRVTMSVGLRAIGGERIAYRRESAARVHWDRTQGSWVEVLGARSFRGAFSGNFGGDSDRDLAQAVALPYFPGREPLWSGDGMVTDFVGQARAASDSVNTRELVNPLAHGAEAFYEFTIGDSTFITFPDGRRITLRELRITARRPQWNLIVGSFWFDDATADLVRAVYRLSMPTDILAITAERGDDRRPPVWLRGFVSPLTSSIDIIAVEYALIDQRFWLPQLQWLEGKVTAGPARATLRIEHRFSYAAVNGVTPPAPAPTDSARTLVVRRYGGAIAIATHIPRDRDALARSPLLPASILDDDEEVFDASARRELTDVLGIGLQPGWAPQSPTWSYGLPVSRYNRVEGLSTGLGVAQALGRGYTVVALLRASAADRQLNGELTTTRTNGRREIGVAAYRRLAAMNDWDEPLSLSASIPALLFGRDNGAYFRTSGVELTQRSTRWSGLHARLFVERQRSASVETRWSAFGDRDRVPENPAATPVTITGVSLHATPQVGTDPQRWRVAGEVAVEAATGTVDYARGLAEMTLSHGLGGALIGGVTAALGSSVGELPPQRAFYLGGPSSVRGHRALSVTGDAFWMARTELGAELRVVRPALFADIGWAGTRNAWRDIGRPLSGAGVGASVFDGLMRIDVSRGMSPVRQWRLDVYLDARF
jgi:hypothetical protein